MQAQGLGHTDKSQIFSDCFHHLLQTRQHAPNNHILHLVVVCTLSLLHMSLSHAALSLLCYVQSLFRFVLRPGQVTPGTIISRDCGPGLHREPLLPISPSWAHYLQKHLRVACMAFTYISENEQHFPYPKDHLGEEEVIITLSISFHLSIPHHHIHLSPSL